MHKYLLMLLQQVRYKVNIYTLLVVPVEVSSEHNLSETIH